MRIVSWNCCGGFASKKNELLALDPDIAIISESLLADADSLKPQGYKSIWFGDGGQKGLAIIYKSSWSIRQQGPSLHKWIIPLDVSGPESFTLLAVWAWQPKGGKTPGYVRVIRKALAEHPEWLSHGPVVMAGDFNSHWKWDAAPTNDFASLVANLSDHGLRSAYHLKHPESEGSEEPTFHQNKKPSQPHHIDYIFIPAIWKTRLKSLEVGPSKYWLDFSDHCPLTADISAA